MKLDCQDYSIMIGDVQEALHEFLDVHKYGKIAVLVDENTKKHCLPLIWDELISSDWTIIEILSGEQNKNIHTCEAIWTKMLMAGMDRHSLMINLGGGVIGDMGGFCAATYMRGIDFVHIPTTLLSQVDSSVGGKLGVDLEMVKNIVGVFHNPQAVFVDKSFLNTLSSEQLRSGFAEMVKHGLIANSDLWNQCKLLKKTGIPLGPDPKNITDELLYESILVKKKVVEKDPREAGLRKILNYGHTIGHAVETASWSSDNPLLHGEAIFVGMVCENYVAYAQNRITKKTLDDVNEILISIFHRPQVVNGSREILDHMQKDKKNKNNIIYAALLEGIGSATYNIELSAEEVMESFKYYKNL